MSHALSSSSEFGSRSLLDPATHAGDPWPFYEWLRTEHPIYWDPQTEMWWVSDYDAIIDVAKSPEIFTSTLGNVPKLPPDPSFINSDGDVHLNRRALIGNFFTPAAVEKLRGHIADAVDGLIDTVIEQGHCDFVRDIARPLPLRIICEMTGIPEEMHADVCDLLDTFMTGGSGPEHVTEEVNEAFVAFGAIHMQLVDERRAEPKDDLLSIWVNANVNGGPMDDDQILFEHTMMLIGGSETARNAISGGVELMAREPLHRERLLADRKLLVSAMEESVRWVTPFLRMSRTLTQDTVFHGHSMKEGDEIAMFYPPANRDPIKFPNPYTFDVGRQFKHKSLAFGHGRHFCLGAFLARAEGEISYERLLARIPDWRLDGEPVPVISSFVRGIKSLPIAFTPHSRSHNRRTA